MNHFYLGPAGGGGVRQPQAHGQLRLQPSGQNKGQHRMLFADFHLNSWGFLAPQLLRMR